MKKTLRLTPALLAATEAFYQAEADYLPGGESASKIELPKLEIADRFLEALAAENPAERARRTPLHWGGRLVR